MTYQWYLRIDGQIQDLLTQERLNKLIAEGKVPPGAQRSGSKDGPWFPVFATEPPGAPPVVDAETKLQSRLERLERESNIIREKREFFKLVALNLLPLVFAVNFGFCVGCWIYYTSLWVFVDSFNFDGFGKFLAMLHGTFSGLLAAWLSFHAARAIRRFSGK